MNEPLENTQEDISMFLAAVDKNIRRMSTVIPKRTFDTDHIDQECALMEQNLVAMIRSVWEVYKKDLNHWNELARHEEERIEKERKEAEERERKRLEDERIEQERLAAIEQARLAEEARIASEKARLEEIARNAPEYALFVRNNQENMKRKIDEHTSILGKILAYLESLNARFPPAPEQPPQP
jgi:hypothetical protein